jgi:hypothetical protein
MNRLFTLLFLLLIPLSTMAQKKLLHKLLHENENLFGEVLQRPEQYDVQIIYTQIDRDEHNVPAFRSFTFGLDKTGYYYPASTVKMPIAFMALEKLKRLNIMGLDKHCTMINGQGSPPQTAALADSTSADGLPSLAHYIKKIFLVSDNDAANRLYEFVGQQQLNEGLWAKGYENLKITHRLGIGGFGVVANQHTNPVSFYLGEKMLYHQAEVHSVAERNFQLNKVKRGKGYYNGDQLVNETFDFSQKNYVSLQDFHDLLKAVIFPEAVPAQQRFDMTEDDYRFLYQVMSQRPRESQFPSYHEPDHYCKFLIYGDGKDGDTMPPSVRIFNKVGWAYGFLTDVAYIVDFETGVEFFLAATIHVNEDGVFNDDNYEYESVGLPFMANLGRTVFAH